MQEGTVLCFDFGLARTGVASGNTVTRSANPLAIIHAKTNDERWKAIEKLIKEWDPVFLVVGVPRHGDGTPSDERFSSVMVEHGTDKIDDEAAAVILQQFFEEQDLVA